jgi:sugar diacid utilization regulator
MTGDSHKEKTMLEDSRISHYTSKLLTALGSDGGGLQKLVDIGYQMLGNPLLITDKSWKAIAMTADVAVPEDTGWQEFLTNGFLSPESVTAGIRDNLADRIEQSRAPFRWQSADMAYPRLFSRIVIGDKTAATLSVIELQPLSEEAYPLLKILCDAVSAELQKNQFQQYSKGMLYEDFIWNLLEGRLTEPRAIEERVRLLNLGIKKNIYVFVFDVREYDVSRYSVSYMRDLLEKMISGGKALVYNDSIVITASFSRARDIFRTELKNLGVFLKEHNIRCGISRRCTRTAELRNFYVQALDAMRIGTHMDADRYIYPYGEYAVYHVAEACAQAGDTSLYCHPALEALIAHDREYKTSFTGSLYTYLKHFRNITDAAKSLHLHRSTMVYHLRRIEEIMDLSLGSYNSVQQLELSFRLLEYEKKIARLDKWDEIPESDR